MTKNQAENKVKSMTNKKILLALLLILSLNCGGSNADYTGNFCPAPCNITYPTRDIGYTPVDMGYQGPRIVHLKSGDMYDTQLGCSCEQKMVYLPSHMFTSQRDDKTVEYLCYPLPMIQLCLGGMYVSDSCTNRAFAPSDLYYQTSARNSMDPLYKGEHCASAKSNDVIFSAIGDTSYFTFGNLGDQKVSDNQLTSTANGYMCHLGTPSPFSCYSTTGTKFHETDTELATLPL